MCSFLVWKNACLDYREFDLEGDLVGVPHTWYLSAQSFTRLLKLVWREYDIVVMNEWKKKCVALQRTWVSKRTVCVFLHNIPALRFTTNCIFTCPRPFSLCTLSLMSFLPGKVDAKLVFGKKPRSWVQDFINKPLIAIYDRTTFRTIPTREGC